MRNRIFLVLLCASVAFILTRCVKDPLVLGEGEPISITAPIQNPTQAESGKDVNYEISIVTDKNIDSVSVFYHIDTLKTGYTSGDAITFVRSHTVTTPTNLSKFSGVFTMPSNLKYGNVVRIIYKLKAKERFAEKILRIDVK